MFNSSLSSAPFNQKAKRIEQKITAKCTSYFSSQCPLFDLNWSSCSSRYFLRHDQNLFVCRRFRRFDLESSDEIVDVPRELSIFLRSVRFSWTWRRSISTKNKLSLSFVRRRCASSVLSDGEPVERNLFSFDTSRDYDREQLVFLFGTSSRVRTFDFNWIRPTKMWNEENFFKQIVWRSKQNVFSLRTARNRSGSASCLKCLSGLIFLSDISFH